MEEELTPQQLKGFNGGYLLAKHEPELYKQLMASMKGDSEYIQGLKMGAKQHDREVLLQQLKQSQQINKSNQKNLDL